MLIQVNVGALINKCADKCGSLCASVPTATECVINVTLHREITQQRSVQSLRSYLIDRCRGCSVGVRMIFVNDAELAFCQWRLEKRLIQGA